MSEQAQRHIPDIRLTGRGAVLGMLAVFALGLLAASWLGWGVLAGAFFVAGSAAAVLHVRPHDLLMVTVAPPLLFCIALVGVKAVTATGDMALSTAEGVAVTLAGAAPWLFVGTALSLAIAWSRGLRERVRELTEELRLGAPPRSPDPADSKRSAAGAPDAPSGAR